MFPKKKQTDTFQPKRFSSNFFILCRISDSFILSSLSLNKTKTNEILVRFRILFCIYNSCALYNDLCHTIFLLYSKFFFLPKHLFSVCKIVLHLTPLVPLFHAEVYFLATSLFFVRKRKKNRLRKLQRKPIVL